MSFRKTVLAIYPLLGALESIASTSGVGVERILADCPDGQCLDPNGRCDVVVNCFVDPCDVQETPCPTGQKCEANYCGGCHDVCVEDSESGGVEPTCPEGECPDDNGRCMTEVSCYADPCEDKQCAGGEICEPNFCGGCYAFCVPEISTGPTSGSFGGPSSPILLDTTSSTVVSFAGGENTFVEATPKNTVEEDEKETNANTPSDCQESQVREAFSSGAYLPFVVSQRRADFSTLVITSEADFNDLLSTLTPLSPEDDLSGFQDIDFTTEQVVFVSYYASSSCNVEITSASYTCSSVEEPLLQIRLEVEDASRGCDVACDAEGQVVYAVVTPLGLEVSFENSVTGPCLVSADSEETPNGESSLESDTEETAPETENGETSIEAENGETPSDTENDGTSSETENVNENPTGSNQDVQESSSSIVRPLGMPITLLLVSLCACSTFSF